MERFGGSRNGVWCSFCEKSQRQVRKLVAGPGDYICNECIDLCSEILENEGIKKKGVAGAGPGEVPASPVAEDRKPRMDALTGRIGDHHLEATWATYGSSGAAVHLQLVERGRRQSPSPG